MYIIIIYYYYLFIIIINDNPTDDEAVISNSFNNYFIHVGPQLAQHIPSHINPLNLVNDTMKSIFIPYISEYEITETVRSLKNSSAGWDFIPASIAKHCLKHYNKPLTYLINSSFESGTFLKELKLAKVIPIFKSGDKQDISNYRPISILSLFSKVFKKTMYNHLNNFIDANKILYKYQFGFRKSHSTNHAIIPLVEKVNNAMDSGKISIGVFLDLRKAFDTVDHCILLDKLYKYGIRGTTWNWYKSYLENRKQYVCYSNTLSATMPITHGVPQGTRTLIIYLIINDLANVSENLFSILFADDTTDLIEGTNINTMIATLNSELAKLTECLNANKLSINVPKSHYMVFHRSRRKINKGNILLDTTILSQVTFTKFLGVIPDDKLNWTHHFSYIENKISKGKGIVLKARKVMKKKVLLQLYHSFVTPYLIYCLEIWGNASDIHLQPLITTHNKSQHYYFFVILLSYKYFI